jgi:5-methylcytosine-specific restriction endonuclease McrA
MSNTLAHHVLVLNKGWTPVGTVTLQRAIIMLFSTYNDGKPKAKIIEPTSYQTMTWEDWSKLRPAATDEVIRTANIAFKIPEIILLTKYEKLPQPRVHFSRRTLYKRDNYTCQYCGCRPGTEELTVEHIHPKSLGGTTTWENCVLACVECNKRKANKTLKQSGMKLLSVPKKPKLALFKCDFNKPIKSWEAFLGEAYWNVGIGDKEDD